MTREEIIRNLKYTMEKHKNDNVPTFGTDISLMCKDILNYLEQEPCEDAVSRKAVVELVEGWWLGHTKEDDLATEVRALPSVTPTRKVGKWKNKSQKSGCGITFIASECTCCGKKTFFNCDELIYNYCPNCGAEMESGE